MEKYLLIVNVAVFLLMFLDKRFAALGKQRIPEKTLLITAALGGALGGTIGMFLFRHKTRHRKFRIGLPVMLVAQAIVVGTLFCM